MAYIIRATFTKSDNKLWPWEEGSPVLTSPEFADIVDKMKAHAGGAKFFEPGFIKSANLCEFEMQFDTREDANGMLVSYLTHSAEWANSYEKLNFRTEYTDWKFKIVTDET